MSFDLAFHCVGTNILIVGVDILSPKVLQDENRKSPGIPKLLLHQRLIHITFAVKIVRLFREFCVQFLIPMRLPAMSLLVCAVSSVYFSINHGSHFPEVQTSFRCYISCLFFRTLFRTFFGSLFFRFLFFGFLFFYFFAHMPFFSTACCILNCCYIRGQKCR